ncbi:hypothetical protein L9F63_000200, partial [Diploptera punctata]
GKNKRKQLGFLHNEINYVFLSCNKKKILTITLQLESRLELSTIRRLPSSDAHGVRKNFVTTISLKTLIITIDVM